MTAPPFGLNREQKNIYIFHLMYIIRTQTRCDPDIYDKEIGFLQKLNFRTVHNIFLICFFGTKKGRWECNGGATNTFQERSSSINDYVPLSVVNWSVGRLVCRVPNKNLQLTLFHKSNVHLFITHYLDLNFTPQFNSSSLLGRFFF